MSDARGPCASFEVNLKILGRIELFSPVNFLLFKFAQLSENNALILANIFQILSVLPGYEDLAR